MFLSKDGAYRPDTYIAKMMYVLFVQDAPDLFKFDSFKLPADKRQLFVSKISHLSEALVLRALTMQSQANPAYQPLLQEFERQIFPAHPAPDEMAKLLGFKATITKLQELTDLEAERKIMWCVSFFKEIGHDETNPATLILLGTLIAKQIDLIWNFIRDLGPPA